METPDSEREKQEGSGCPSIASCASLTLDAGTAGSSAMDKTAIQYYIQKCSKNNFSDKTLLRKVASIKSFYKFLTHNGIVNYNISSLISSPKIAKKIGEYSPIKFIKCGTNVSMLLGNILSGRILEILLSVKKINLSEKN